MKCLGLRRADKKKANANAEEGEIVSTALQIATAPNPEAPNTHVLPESFHSSNNNKDLILSDKPCRKDTDGKMLEIEAIAVHGDSWVLPSTSQKKFMPSAKFEMSKSNPMELKKQKKITGRPSQMTQELTKLQEQYKALQSSFKRLNNHVSSSETSKSNEIKVQRTASRHTVHEMHGRHAQPFRPTDSRGIATTHRLKSPKPNHQNQSSNSFRKSGLIRFVGSLEHVCPSGQSY